MDFPENIVALLAEHLGKLEGVTAVVRRSLNMTDPHGTLGITVDSWRPLESEMGVATQEPTIVQHSLALEHVVKADSAEVGHQLHRDTAKTFRLMLYRDPALNVALRQLNAASGDGHVERILKWEIPAQEFANNEIASAFVFMSSTEILVTTETL